MDPKKGVDFSKHPVVDLVLQVEDAEKFPQALVSKAWILFSKSASRVYVSQPQRRMEVTRDLYSLSLLVKLTALHCQILFNMAIAEAILMQTSAEQVPSLHRLAPRFKPFRHYLTSPAVQSP